MRICKNKLIEIIKMKENSLIEFLESHKDCKRKGKYYWLWLRSPELPYLVAHIDTVYSRNRKIEIIHNKKYIWSPQGIGGDDRCGVYALIELYNKLNVNCLFTDYEEKGALGANEFVNKEKDLLEKIPYLIEIDRRGNREAVFYNYDDYNKEFLSVIEKYFSIGIGSFSDIAIIGQYANCCSVNLSAGFVNEHSKESEYIVIPYLEYTLKEIPKIIEELGDKRYELPDKYLSDWYDRYYDNLEFSGITVKLIDGSIIEVSSYDELEDLLLIEEITEEEFKKVLKEIEDKSYKFYSKYLY